MLFELPVFCFSIFVEQAIFFCVGDTITTHLLCLLLMFKLRAIVLLVLVCFRGEAFAVQKKAVERPRPMLLHSSYTAWTSDNQASHKLQ